MMPQQNPLPIAFTTIRRSTADDRTDILRILLNLQDAETTLHPMNRRPWEKADAEEYFARLEQDTVEKQGACFVALAENRIVGMTLGFIEHDIEDLQVHAHEKRYGYISEGYVEPAYRHQGIYRALITELENHFLRQGVTLVRRTTLADNKLLQDSARSMGYRPYEIVFEKRLGAIQEQHA